MGPHRPPLSSVEEVRAELRRLGYFEHGLDRFVLEGAVAPSPLRASLGAALRIGLLGGIFFGAAFSLAAAALDPRLRAEPRDLLVLALYLAPVLGVATAILALAGGLAAAWWLRGHAREPGPALGRNIGLGLGTLAIAYLALWWRSHAWDAPLLLQVSGALVGLGLSAALARFGVLAAVAVLSAGGRGARLPQARLSLRHQLPLLALVALVFGAGVGAAAWLGPADAPAPPDFAVVPTGLRVRVVAIDGLERRMAEQAVARGDMPNIEGLLARGARARLQAEPEQVPAIVWTTVATGRGPEAHGIQSTGARRLAGMRTPVPLAEHGPFTSALAAAADLFRITHPQPATAVLRGVKTFWNVASEKGLRVGVVNWWATWPASAVNGYVVTDRAFFKLEKGGAFDREVYPPEAFEGLRARLPPPSADRPRTLDQFHTGAALALRRQGAAPDLEAVYLSGLDIETMQRLGDAAASDPATLEARLLTVRAYYRYVDGLLGELVADAGPGDVVIVVGDPGRLARRDAGATGLLVLSGGPVQTADLGTAGERDLAPTVLHLVGLPVSRELAGQPLVGALVPEFRAAHPVRHVPSYGRPPAARPADSAFDRQMLEELRSLGYIR
jgi:hypothetical protein